MTALTFDAAAAALGRLYDREPLAPIAEAVGMTERTLFADLSAFMVELRTIVEAARPTARLIPVTARGGLGRTAPRSAAGLPDRPAGGRVMGFLIGHTQEEREAFARNAGILAELVVLKTPLARLAIRHATPREVLIRELHSHLGMCIATLHADVDGSKLVDAPPEPPAPPGPPVRIRKRGSHEPQHLGPKKPPA